MTSIINFRTTLAAGLCAILGYLVYVNQTQISRAVGIAATVLFVLLIVLIVGFAILYWKRETTRQARLEDGSFPLLQKKMQDGAIAIIDPNLMPAGAGIFHPKHGWMQIAPADWQAQMQYAATVQATRNLEAIHPGDQAQIRTHGAIDQPRMPANVTKLLTAPKEPPKPITPPAIIAPPPAAPPAPRLTLTDALGQSTGSRWIVGQSDTGQIAAFEPASHAHAAIVGTTGTGKTSSVGFLMTLAALRAGWHVVVINPDGNRPPPNGGPGWHLFEQSLELHDTDPQSFPGQVESIYNFYERRASLSNPRPVLVVFEEYGDTIRHLRKRNRSDADQVDVWLDTLLTRGRKSRVHTAFVDQYPEHWSHSVLGGTKFQAVFKLGPGQGPKMEEYRANQLPDVGRFLVRGVEYNSFDASTQAAAILSRLPAPASTKRIINGTATHVPASSVVSSPARSPQFAQEVDPPTPTPSEPAEPSGPTDIQAQAQAMIAANPATKQVDLIDKLGIAKGYANELWHKYHPAGRNYQLPTGTMDLTIDADRQQFQQLLAAGAITYPEPKQK